MKHSFLLIAVLGLLSSCAYDKGPVPVQELRCDSVVSYAADIAPIMTNYCNSCHMPGGSGLSDFSNYAGLKQKVDNGSVKNRVLDLKDMPQPGSPPLSDEQRQLISCWLKQGAPDN